MLELWCSADFAFRANMAGPSWARRPAEAQPYQAISAGKPAKVYVCGFVRQLRQRLYGIELGGGAEVFGGGAPDGVSAPRWSEGKPSVALHGCGPKRRSSCSARKTLL